MPECRLTRPVEITVDAVNAEVKAIVGNGIELPEELEAAVGEVCVLRLSAHKLNADCVSGV